MNKKLYPEDYLEPECPLCMNEDSKEKIPVNRIINKYDEFINRDNKDAALNLLKYWYNEARFLKDYQGMLVILNELMGYYRINGELELALAKATEAKALVDRLYCEKDSLSFATTYLNIATVYKAASKSDKAIPLYEITKKIYEENLNQNDSRIAGLYNNMGLALVDEKRYDEATTLYNKAILINDATNNQLDSAITILNIATMIEKKDGLENGEKYIIELLEKAMQILDSKKETNDGYYAFVCSKCASVYSYYGYFLYANELNERAKRIYERS